MFGRAEKTDREIMGDMLQRAFLPAPERGDRFEALLRELSDRDERGAQAGDARGDRARG